MRLKEYLYKHRWTITDFAKLVEFRREFISQLVNGKIKTSKRSAKLIASFTNGEVSPEEILSEYKAVLPFEKKSKKIVAENSDK